MNGIGLYDVSLDDFGTLMSESLNLCVCVYMFFFFPSTLILN